MRRIHRVAPKDWWIVRRHSVASAEKRGCKLLTCRFEAKLRMTFTSATAWRAKLCHHRQHAENGYSQSFLSELFPFAKQPDRAISNQ
jgi:hypothetical protein